MLKQINLIQDFSKQRALHKDFPIDQEVVRNYVTYGMTLGNKEGLSAEKRRMFDRIANKFDLAIETTASHVQLNAYEYAFLKESFKKAVVPPQETQLFVIIEDAVENAIDVDGE